MCVLAQAGKGPGAAPDDGSLLRLALWLAEVSAEAGQAAMIETVAPEPRKTEPRVSELAP